MSKLWKHLSGIALTLIEGDLLVKRIEILSARLNATNDRLDALSRRLDIVSGRVDSHARPRCGQWHIENGGFYLYDDRGQMLASISMLGDGYGWGAAQPHKTSIHGESDNVPDAQKAVLDALRPWCDVSAAESEGS